MNLRCTLTSSDESINHFCSLLDSFVSYRIWDMGRKYHYTSNVIKIQRNSTFGTVRVYVWIQQQLIFAQKTTLSRYWQCGTFVLNLPFYIIEVEEFDPFVLQIPQTHILVLDVLQKSINLPNQVILLTCKKAIVHRECLMNGSISF